MKSISGISRDIRDDWDIMISSQLRDIRDIMDIKGYQQYWQGYLNL